MGVSTYFRKKAKRDYIGSKVMGPFPSQINSWVGGSICSLGSQGVPTQVSGAQPYIRGKTANNYHCANLGIEDGDVAAVHVVAIEAVSRVGGVSGVVELKRDGASTSGTHQDTIGLIVILIFFFSLVAVIPLCTKGITAVDSTRPTYTDKTRVRHRDTKRRRNERRSVCLRWA